MPYTGSEQGKKHSFAVNTTEDDFQDISSYQLLSQTDKIIRENRYPARDSTETSGDGPVTVERRQLPIGHGAEYSLEEDQTKTPTPSGFVLEKLDTVPIPDEANAAAGAQLDKKRQILRTAKKHQRDLNRDLCHIPVTTPEKAEEMTVVVGHSPDQNSR